jgi:hypothetical protein
MIPRQAQLARKSDEDNGETPNASADIPPTGYSKRVTDFLHEHGHHALATEIENATGGQATSQQQSAPQEPVNPRVVDQAKCILMEAGMKHELPEETAADIWDDYYSARTSSEFAEKLNAMKSVPDALKSELFEAYRTYRHIEPPKPSKVDKVVEAIMRIGSKVLPMPHVEALEKRPHVLKALTDAILKQRDGE